MSLLRPNRRQTIAGAGAAMIAGPARAQYPQHKPRFRALLLAEKASGDHQSFVDAGKSYIASIAPGNGFAFNSITSTNPINDEFLAQYDVIIQLNYPPFGWTPIAQAAFERYITLGKGGWVGFHHAALLGDFDGYPMSPWFSHFMGGIRFTHYLPNFARATVRIEDRNHPLAKGLPESFVIPKEEWYTWDRSPRPNVHVIANVDEASYQPNTMVKMGGDHPVIWSNPHVKARNVYIFMGHYAGLFNSPEFARLFQNAIFWGAGQ